MKKLFFTFAFIFVGTLVFASPDNKVEKVSEADLETVVSGNSAASNDFTFSLNQIQITDSEQLTLKDCTLKGEFTITFSDGDSITWKGTLTIVGQSCAEFLKELMAD